MLCSWECQPICIFTCPRRPSSAYPVQVTKRILVLGISAGTTCLLWRSWICNDRRVSGRDGLGRANDWRGSISSALVASVLFTRLGTRINYLAQHECDQRSKQKEIVRLQLPRGVTFHCCICRHANKSCAKYVALQITFEAAQAIMKVYVQVHARLRRAANSTPYSVVHRLTVEKVRRRPQ